MSNTADHRKILGVAQNATHAEITQATHALLRNLQPVINPSPALEQTLTEVVTAYKELTKYKGVVATFNSSAQLDERDLELHYAVLDRNFDKANLLLAQGAQPFEETIYEAIRRDRTEAARFLVKANMPITPQMIDHAARVAIERQDKDPQTLYALLQTNVTPSGKTLFKLVEAGMDLAVRICISKRAQPTTLMVFRAMKLLLDPTQSEQVNRGSTMLALIAGGAIPDADTIKLAKKNKQKRWVDILSQAAKDNRKSVVQYGQSIPLAFN